MSRLLCWLQRRGRAGATRLDLCLGCGGRFVYPVSWTESGPAAWWLLLRCGSCGTVRDVVASNRIVEEFDRQLDREMDMIKDAAERLEKESFSDEADAFGTALRLDLLTADDFR